MITAEEAYKLTTNTIANLVNEELAKIELDIKKAIMKGKYTTYLDDMLHETKISLTELGYVVTYGGVPLKYCIRWGDVTK